MNVSIKPANYARKFDMAPKYWDDIFGEFDDCMRSKAVPNQFRASAQVARWRPSQKGTAEEGLVLSLKSLLWNLCWTSDLPWGWSRACSRWAQMLHGLESYGLKQSLHIHRWQEWSQGLFSGLTLLPSPTHITDPIFTFGILRSTIIVVHTGFSWVLNLQCLEFTFQGCNLTDLYVISLEP